MPITNDANKSDANKTDDNEIPKKSTATTERKARASEQLSKQDKPAATEDDNANPQFYVHLANGEVKRCEEEDLPQSAGSNAPHGFWVENGKAFQVVGVYPAETDVK